MDEYNKTEFTSAAIDLFCDRNPYARPYTMGMENLLLKNHSTAIKEIEKELEINSRFKFRLVNTYFKPDDPRYIIADHLKVEDMRGYAKTFGFKKERVEKLIFHSSKKFFFLNHKDYTLYKDSKISNSKP